MERQEKLRHRLQANLKKDLECHRRRAAKCHEEANALRAEARQHESVMRKIERQIAELREE